MKNYKVYLEDFFSNYYEVGHASTKREAEKIGRSELKKAVEESRLSNSGFRYRNFCIYNDHMIHYPTPKYVKKQG